MGVLVFGAIGRLDTLAHGKEYCLNYNMDFILAHSRYRRGRFEEAIQTCDELLSKNSKDEVLPLDKAGRLGPQVSMSGPR